jgi:hypothetical protein
MTGPLSASLDLPDVTAALSVLTSAFPGRCPTVDERMLVVWWERLRQFEPDDVLGAARQCTRLERFPSLEQVAQSANGLARRRREAQPAIATNSLATSRPDLSALKAHLLEHRSVEAARAAEGRARRTAEMVREQQARLTTEETA